MGENTQLRETEIRLANGPWFGKGLFDHMAVGMLTRWGYLEEFVRWRKKQPLYNIPGWRWALRYFESYPTLQVLAEGLQRSISHQRNYRRRGLCPCTGCKRDLDGWERRAKAVRKYGWQSDLPKSRSGK